MSWKYLIRKRKKPTCAKLNMTHGLLTDQLPLSVGNISSSVAFFSGSLEVQLGTKNILEIVLQIATVMIFIVMVMKLTLNPL